MFGIIKKGKIDRLSNQKRKLVLKKDRIQQAMRERNSARETQIKVLENKGVRDYEIANKKALEIDRQIEKIMREIDSEQIYANAVADMEKKQYADEQNAEKLGKVEKK